MEVMQAVQKLQKAQARVENKVLELQENQDTSRQMFGLVAGGTKERAVLYDAIPRSPADKPVAKTLKGDWLKLSYPRKVVPQNSVPFTWYRAHILNGDEIKLFWVRDKAEDGSPTFKTIKLSAGTDPDDDDDDDDDEDDE